MPNLKMPQYKIVNERGFYKIYRKGLFGWKALNYILPKKLVGTGSRFGGSYSYTGEYGDNSLEDTEKLLKVIRAEPYRIFEKISYDQYGNASGSGKVVLVEALKVAELYVDFTV